MRTGKRKKNTVSTVLRRGDFCLVQYTATSCPVSVRVSGRAYLFERSRYFLCRVLPWGKYVRAQVEIHIVILCLQSKLIQYIPITRSTGPPSSISSPILEIQVETVVLDRLSQRIEIAVVFNFKSGGT